MRKTLRVLFVITFSLLLIGGGVGCTRNRTRTRVGGMVLKESGQPVKIGEIKFTQVNGGKTYTDPISSGRYSIRSRYSLPAGDYTVTIRYSSSPKGETGFDRTHTERVTLLGLGKDSITFRVK